VKQPVKQLRLNNIFYELVMNWSQIRAQLWYNIVIVHHTITKIERTKYETNIPTTKRGMSR